ncbi:type II/IV secretion system secretin RcpA/CpaC [Vibrio variabilis]|uniref:Type II/IV secretion system secretin RcpA/CpaC n=1 Tax=Vibrio variabilis TaxID=990271 RepID=A0ABQ0JRX1_9VIBR|nr:type II/IV secretion system secretin RcpA/CpaC [Vibrio variabilis]
MDYLNKSKWSFVIAAFSLLMSFQVVYAGQQYITVNDAKHIELGEKITKVFISDPDIVDYNVINENTIVVFAKAVGRLD